VGVIAEFAVGAAAGDDELRRARCDRRLSKRPEFPF
jgi:hypothetical protein